MAQAAPRLGTACAWVRLDCALMRAHRLTIPPRRDLFKVALTFVSNARTSVLAVPPPRDDSLSPTGC